MKKFKKVFVFMHQAVEGYELLIGNDYWVVKAIISEKKLGFDGYGKKVLIERKDDRISRLDRRIAAQETAFLRLSTAYNAHLGLHHAMVDPLSKAYDDTVKRLEKLENFLLNDDFQNNKTSPRSVNAAKICKFENDITLSSDLFKNKTTFMATCPKCGGHLCSFDDDLMLVKKSLIVKPFCPYCGLKVNGDNLAKQGNIFYDGKHFFEMPDDKKNG